MMIPREPTPRSSIDESKYIAAECPILMPVGLCPASETAQTPLAQQCRTLLCRRLPPRYCAAERKVQKLSFEQSLIPPRFANKNFENYSRSPARASKPSLKPARNLLTKSSKTSKTGVGCCSSARPEQEKTHLGCSNSLRGDFGRGKTALFTTVGKMLSEDKNRLGSRSCG